MVCLPNHLETKITLEQGGVVELKSSTIPDSPSTKKIGRQSTKSHY